MSDLIERAKEFATAKHFGQKRKFGDTPYIVHPIEVAEIISTMTDDENTIAAGLLHDTVEDTDATPEEILENFGPRVYALVCSETEDKMKDRPAAETWEERKKDSLSVLENTDDLEIKKIWLGDKLSNMRSFLRIWKNIGDSLWTYLHQKDKSKQAWYYRTVASDLEELKDTEAYKEYISILDEIFSGC